MVIRRGRQDICVVVEFETGRIERIRHGRISRAQRRRSVCRFERGALDDPWCCIDELHWDETEDAAAAVVIDIGDIGKQQQ